MNKWKREEKIALIGLFVAIVSCIAAVVVIPEVRQILGLQSSTTSTPISKLTSTHTSTPTSTPTDTPTKISTPTLTPTDTLTKAPTFTLTPTDTPTSAPTSTPTPIIDTRGWRIFENGGNIVSLNPGLRLEQGISNQFPFLITRENPFPATGDFEVEILFRYSSVTGYGTGIAIGSCCPQNGQSVGRYPELLLSICQDSQGFRLVRWNYTAQPDEIFFQGKGSTSLALHQAVIRYLADDSITVSIDGHEVISFVAARRPERIWLGNPISVEKPGEWSTLEVMSVEITSQ